MFGMDCIAQISPEDGRVRGWLMLAGLLKEKVKDPGNDVLNGIAYLASKPGRLFVTGKEWPKLFEMELVPSRVSVAAARQACIPKRNIFTGWTLPKNSLP